MASQVLLGRLHRRDGMHRLMLRFRELLDVVLRRVELPRSRSISCGAAARCALFGAVAADCSLNRSRPSAFDQAKASAPMALRPSATMASIRSRAPIRRRRACRTAAASPNSSSSTSSLGMSGGSNRLGITAFTVAWRCTDRAALRNPCTPIFPCPTRRRATLYGHSQVRTGLQRRDRQDTGPHDAAGAACHRQRGHRMSLHAPVRTRMDETG